MTRKILSDKIINFIVSKGYDDALIIKEQYENAELNFEEVSCALSVYINYSGDKRTSRSNYEINDIGIKYPNKDIGVTVFIRNGLLDMIECYTYGDVIFPSGNDGEPYQIKYNKLNNDIE